MTNLAMVELTLIMANNLVPQEIIENKIFLSRGMKVMLDRDLAELYKVRARALRQQVKRNIERFPNDFMIKLTKKEAELLVSQFVTPSRSSFGGHLPYAFTELGVAMLSSVLNSKRAIQVNIQIMRTFAKLKEMIASHKDLKHRIDELEKKYDSQFKVVFDAIKYLIQEEQKPKRKIGFI